MENQFFKPLAARKIKYIFYQAYFWVRQSGRQAQECENLDIYPFFLQSDDLIKDKCIGDIREGIKNIGDPHLILSKIAPLDWVKDAPSLNLSRRRRKIPLRKRYPLK